ncbi:MAG: tetratricopeptide repeat protein [Blastocatellia bacterium]|nr:tetratricopeptide repeat protein [Blastocatellia bacterium]
MKAGNRHAQARQFEQAIEAYREALKLKPDLPAAHHGLGSVYINLGRNAEALEHLRAAVRLDPENPIAHLNLGINLANLRRGDDAMVELREANRLSPRDARIHNEIGNALHNVFGRYEDALASYEEARRLNPNVPAVHHNIGLMLVRLGKGAEAIPRFEEALRLNPAYQNARYLLSNAYSRAGRYEEAVDSWTRFLQLRPRGREALQNRAWNRMYLGKEGDAAASDALQFLEVAGWRDAASPFMALIAHLGYRRAGRDAEARDVLAEAEKHCDRLVWPYAIIQCLRGEISPEELLQMANDAEKKTEAHTYLGMDLLLNGRLDEARGHFAWVKEYGNNRFLEHSLAIAELIRLGGK